MNKTLKFSWGHIIAFLALIFISYITFVGITYLTDGDFLSASIGMGVVDLVLLFWFIGAQLKKGTERNFKKSIKFERFFVFSSPIIFVLVMLPFDHFWTVFQKDSEIVEQFSDAITLSEKLFDDYEDYAHERIENYEGMLDRVISNKNIRRNEFKTCGFVFGKEHTQRDNMVKVLQLQLLSTNYDSLKHVAKDWIASSSNGASTFNVFLLGNTKVISKAIGEWQEQLVSFTSKKVSNEEFQGYNEVKNFNGESKSVEKAQKELSSLNEKYINFVFPNVWAWLVNIILYVMLSLPYLIQIRHPKSMYSLFGKKSL